MIVYKITNDVNNKMYIGQTCLPDITRRWKNHILCSQRGSCNCPKLYKAMRKYGLSHFKIEILLRNVKDQTLLNTLEKALIKKFDTIRNGYNCLPGGAIAITEETKISISKALKALYKTKRGRVKIKNHSAVMNDFYNTYKGVELKQRNAERGRKYLGALNPNFGNGDKLKGPGHHNYGNKFVLITDGSKTKQIKPGAPMPEGWRIGFAKNSRVICFSPDMLEFEIFDTQKQAAERYGIDVTNISAALRGRQKTAAGMKWKHYSPELEIELIKKIQ